MYPHINYKYTYILILYINTSILPPNSLHNIVLVLKCVICTYATELTAQPCSPPFSAQDPVDVLACTEPHALGRARGDDQVIQLTAPHPWQTHKWKCQNKRSISLSNIVRLVVVSSFCFPSSEGGK